MKSGNLDKGKITFITMASQNEYWTASHHSFDIADRTLRLPKSSSKTLSNYKFNYVMIDWNNIIEI